MTVLKAEELLQKKCLWKKMVPLSKLKEHLKVYMANHYQDKVNTSLPFAVA